MASRKEEYRAYLQTEQWAAIRARVYKDAEGYCVICQAPAEAVHHKCYPDNIEEDTVAGKWAVCDRCHRALHGIHTHSPRERAEITTQRAMADFIADTGLPPDKVIHFTNRILLIMARYYQEDIKNGMD